MVYIYAFDRYAGGDGVFVSQWSDLHAGDLIEVDDDYFLVLGEHVAFPELTTKPVVWCSAPKVKIDSLLSSQVLTFVHRFVADRFTTYKNALPLWLGSDIDQLMRRKTSSLGTTKPVGHRQVSDEKITYYEQSAAGQQLIVFPDIWTMRMWLGQELSLSPQPGTVILYSQRTHKQKAESYRAIKQGKIQSVISTYSQIFRDWSDLREIVLIDQHTWWYKHPQDPRYHAGEIASQLAELYGARLVTTWVAPLAMRHTNSQKSS